MASMKPNINTSSSDIEGRHQGLGAKYLQLPITIKLPIIKIVHNLHNGWIEPREMQKVV